MIINLPIIKCHDSCTEQVGWQYTFIYSYDTRCVCILTQYIMQYHHWWCSASWLLIWIHAYRLLINKSKSSQWKVAAGWYMYCAPIPSRYRSICFLFHHHHHETKLRLFISRYSSSISHLFVLIGFHDKDQITFVKNSGQCRYISCYSRVKSETMTFHVEITNTNKHTHVPSVCSNIAFAGWKKSSSSVR